MKKNWKRALAFLTAVSCLVGSRLPVYASQTGEEGEVIPRVTFENEEKNSPDLYIKKTVENASEDDPAPVGDEFTFTLRLDGELVKQTVYRVFGADGEEIKGKTELPGVGNETVEVPDPFKTDRNGNFTLEAGQTAVFEGVGSGVAYEVTEEEKEGYVQLSPAGGAAAAGTVTAKGARAEFTNLYEPSGTGGKTRLEVRKTVSFPAGYEAPESPEFTFRVSLGGKAYADEAYTVKDTATGKEIPSTEGAWSTNAQGEFALKGGQTAVFADIEIPKGVDALDYRVEELPLTGEKAGEWRNTGASVQEGATRIPVTSVVFNNASASFAVTKQMEDGSKPDVAFTFLLTRADRSVWADAPYYLYRTTGEPESTEVQTTSGKGTFQLKPGQTAVFVGIPAGTVYNVSEQADPGYVQTVPVRTEGYTDKTVTDSVEVLTFVNRAVEPERSLNVTKVVENTGTEAPFAQDTFHFILSKWDNRGNYIPVENAVYRIQVGNSEYTYYTGTDGEMAGSPEAYRDNTPGGFTLKAGETAHFTGIAPGEYRVKEGALALEYRVQKNGSVRLEGPAMIETVKGEPVNLTFVNWYTPKKLNLNILKKNRSKDPLEGAEFQLYHDAALTSPVAGGSGRTNDSGTLVIPDLKTGTYYLAETRSPAGYRLLAKPVKLELMRRTGGEISILIDGIDRSSGDTQADYYAVRTEEANDEVYITVYNDRGFALPMTGGRGIVWNLLAGAACVALLLRMSRRKKGPKE